MAKFSELSRKQRIQYLQEIQEGKRLPSENIHMNSVLIVPPDQSVEEFIDTQDIQSNFLNRTCIILPSNGREVMNDE